MFCIPSSKSVQFAVCGTSLVDRKLIFHFKKIGIYFVKFLLHLHGLEKSEMLAGNKIRRWNIQNYLLSAS